MTQLTEHFKRAEFACKCGCGYDTADYELANVLEELRAHFNQEIPAEWGVVTVVINSACRCSKHNAEVGGEDHSQHLYGRAADIVVKHFTPKEVYDYLVEKYPDKYGVGLYETFVHIDTRTNGPARW